MYETKPTETYSANPVAEDKRIDLMRQFVNLSDDLDRMREQQSELDERQSVVSKECERVRRDLDSIIHPEQVPAAPSEYR